MTQLNTQNKLQIIREYQRETGCTNTFFSRLTGINNSIVSRILKGSYTAGTADEKVNALYVAVKNQQEADSTPNEIIDTSIIKAANLACDLARQNKSIAALPGKVGIGKTTALKEYVKNNPRSYLIEPDSTFTLGVLINDLCSKVGVMLPRSQLLANKAQLLIQTLAGTDSLIIVDEAETLAPKQLEFLRRIRDKAGVGVLLAGTENLTALLNPHTGQFDQIRSRIDLYPQTIAGITFDDCKTTCDIRLDADPQTVKILWQYCGGSMRVLTDLFINNILKLTRADTSIAINAQLVHHIASNMLNLQKPA